MLFSKNEYCFSRQRWQWWKSNQCRKIVDWMAVVAMKMAMVKATVNKDLVRMIERYEDGNGKSDGKQRYCEDD